MTSDETQTKQATFLPEQKETNRKKEQSHMLMVILIEGRTVPSQRGIDVVSPIVIVTITVEMSDASSIMPG